MYEKTDALDKEKIVGYIANLQNDDGSFAGDEWGNEDFLLFFDTTNKAHDQFFVVAGEVDTRFSFCAIACLALLVSYFRSSSLREAKRLNKLIISGSFERGRRRQSGRLRFALSKF